MQSPAKYDHDNAGYYDCEGGADAAKRYAGVGSNLGAGQMRKLVKTAEMMQDPDFEEHLDQLMRTFCMLMFEVCTLVERGNQGQRQRHSDAGPLPDCGSPRLVQLRRAGEHGLPSERSVYCAAREAQGCDADGGAAGAESDEEGVDLEEQAQQEADVLIPVDSSDDEVAEDTDGEGEGEGEDEYEDGELDSSDEEDDMADISSVANAIGNAAAPEGWKVIKEAPALNTEPELQALIGKHILYGHDSRAATGWLIGCVHSRNLTARDLKQAPTANFVVCYTAKLTDKKLVGKVACELSLRIHGPSEWWVVVVTGTTPKIGVPGPAVT